MDFADVELPGRTEESEDFGSMEMKPMGKAAFMSYGSWWVSDPVLCVWCGMG